MWQQGRKSRSQKRTRQPQWRAQTARGIRQCCRRCHKSVLASRQASKFARWFPSTLRNSQAACQALPACCLTIPHAGQLGMYVCHIACSTLQVYSALMTALHVLEMYCGLCGQHLGVSVCCVALCTYIFIYVHADYSCINSHTSVVIVHVSLQRSRRSPLASPNHLLCLPWSQCL